MADQSYTPLEHEVRESFVIGQIRDGEGADWTEFEGQARAEFDRFIEAVKRDAARAALTNLPAHLSIEAHQCAAREGGGEYCLRELGHSGEHKILDTPEWSSERILNQHINTYSEETP